MEINNVSELLSLSSVSVWLSPLKLSHFWWLKPAVDRHRVMCWPVVSLAHLISKLLLQGWIFYNKKFNLSMLIKSYFRAKNSSYAMPNTCREPKLALIWQDIFCSQLLFFFHEQNVHPCPLIGPNNARLWLFLWHNTRLWLADTGISTPRRCNQLIQTNQSFYPLLCKSAQLCPRSNIADLAIRQL